ncbi:MAG TPA: hypothetical protein VH418_11715 [Solirubrobacteraceae bacterium]
MKRIAPALALVLSALLAPAAAAGDGPALGADSRDGVVGSGIRYQALQWSHETVVTAVRVADGRALAYRRLPGRWGVPAVSYDGTATGVSADGSTLVLVESRATFPRERTRMLVLGARNLRVRDRIALRGDFSLDAISPDAASIYLVEALSRRNPAHYQVRVYDMRAGRLLARPLVDRREPDEKMQGYAVTRATSADGRWNYTLYDRPAGTPFIHALDTDARRAYCIDLDGVAPIGDYGATRLDLGDRGGRLRLLVNGVRQAAVNTRTFAVRAPLPARHPASAPAPEAGGGDGPHPTPHLLAAAAAASLAAGGLLLVRRAPGSVGRREEDRAETTLEVWR